MQQDQEFHFSKRMSRIDTSQIRKVFDLAARLPDPVNMSIGQPHYAMPQPIVHSIERALRDGRTSYTPTQGIMPLRERLSLKYKQENNFEISPDDILISSGVSSLLQLLFLCLLDPGDRILLTDPCFLIYRSLASFFDIKMDFLPEEFTRQDIEKINPENLRMILYSSPSNPSGYIMKTDQIRMLADLSDRSGALLVSDEIYELFDYEKQFVSAASLHPKTMTLTGFSKTYSMTGLRLAAAAGPSGIIKAMTTLQQYTVVCAPAAVQWGGIQALDLDMSEYVEMYRKNRDECVKRLSGKLQFSKPGGAFYIFPKVPGKDSEFVERAIKEKQLLLVPGSIFSSAKDRIRISYAASPENLERGLTALIDLL